jgi:hypothetical protein
MCLEIAIRMDSWFMLGFFNKQDESSKSDQMVYPVMKNLKTVSTIWCPFDAENLEFEILSRSHGDITEVSENRINSTPKNKI